MNIGSGRSATGATTYADRRESRRLRSAWLSLGFVVAIGVAVAIRLNGPLPWLTLVVLATILVVFGLALARSGEPKHLTRVENRIQAGTWRASLRASLFPGVIERYPRMNEFAELSGTVSFTESGVSWRPTDRTRRLLGVNEHTWDPSWQMEARRLPGFGHLVQVNLQSRTSPEQVTIWMRGARDFAVG